MITGTHALECNMVGFSVSPTIGADKGIVMTQLDLEGIGLKEGKAFEIAVTEEIKERGSIRGIRQALREL
jgi:hypothetical protein